MSDLPKHPGLVLLDEWLKPREITQYKLAKLLHTETRRVNEICEGIRNIGPEMALRLSIFFENEPRFWLDLQANYDLEVARRKVGERLAEEIHPWSVVK